MSWRGRNASGISRTIPHTNGCSSAEAGSCRRGERETTMIEVALFGAGRIGSIHAGNLVRLPGVKLKYVVDVNRAAAVDLAVKLRAEVRTADAALADEAVS